jgi:hypothetical protein
MVLSGPPVRAAREGEAASTIATDQRATRHGRALLNEPGLARVSRLRPVHQLRLHIFRQVPQGVSLSKGRRFHGQDDGNARLRL